ncbi:MAG: DUF3703 domain-containing protein [Acidobacteria bacterium]|nr:DUF3703 domain-containing protein [Acidobacteriota bacterium]
MTTNGKTIIAEAVDREIALAEELTASSNLHSAFHHLERAHVLGQASTYHHTRIHLRMLNLAIKLRSPREIWGQLFRIIGASTKTPLGIYPTGNTGGSNVWFFRSMSIPSDLQAIIEHGKKEAIEQ